MADRDKEIQQKLLATFQGEAEDHLQDIVSNIVLLEQGRHGAEHELVARILKRLHTLKGAARAVSLAELERLCHAMEDTFSAMKAGAGTGDPAHFDILHQAADLARSLSNAPSGRVRNRTASVVAQLEQLSQEIAANKAKDRQVMPLADAGALAAEPRTDAGPGSIDDHAAAAAANAASADIIRVQGKSLDAICYQSESLLAVDLGLLHHIRDLTNLAEELADWHASFVPQTSEKHARPEAGGDAKALPPHGDHDSENFASRCRGLANALIRTHRQFAGIRARLMEATLETALVPLSSALEHLPGMARNLARGNGKEVYLEIDDAGVQIDRRVLDVAREACMHLVTNAVAHGIERREARVAAGKPPAGTVRITAVQHGGDRLALTVADDGAGINVAAVAEAAVRNGVLDAGQIAELDEQQKLQLVMRGGVSTSARLTSVSGRGVGLPVVGDRVASLGGALRIDNSPGAGCAFEMLLPVRLATLTGLLVRAGGRTWVFPISAIESVQAVGKDDIRTVNSRETLVLGGHVLPAIRLGDLLRLPGPDRPSLEAPKALIVRSGAHQRFALLVDEVLAEQEVLPKGLGKQLRRVRYVAGATQLGDGSLVLILNPEDIALHGLAPGKSAAAVESSPRGEHVKRLLVAEDSITSRLLLKHILEGAGYQVETAVDGVDALARVRQQKFDAIVSDIEMPRLDGIALTEHLRRDPETEDMPVILVTSLQSSEDKERGLRAGADAYVVKGSFDQDNLLTAIRRLI